MKKITLLPLVLGLFVLIGAGCFGLKNTTEINTASPTMLEEQEMNEMDDEMTEGDEEMEEEMSEDMENEMDDTRSEEMSAGTYEAYSESKLAMANTGDVVLFFKADWCPSCRALDANIKANLDMIPDGLTILEVDFDEATELKRKYGVTTQHTLVQVDADGNELKQWSGGAALASITTEVE